MDETFMANLHLLRVVWNRGIWQLHNGLAGCLYAPHYMSETHSFVLAFYFEEL
jgi:hypothetical protein